MKSVPSVDLAGFLIRRFHVDDFVVLKLDVEGAEYAIIPHLIASGAVNLIDEMFFEGHTDANSCCRAPPLGPKHRSHVVELLRSLRNAGVYVHEHDFP